MARVIVPVGLDMGQDFAASGSAEHAPEYWQVHLGGELVQLDADETVVWGAAFLDPQQHAVNEVNRQSLEARLRGMDRGPTDPAPTVTRLLERGLLIEFDPVGGPLEAMFRGLQLFPLAQGMGNTPEHVDRYSIGFGGRALVEVGPNVYSVWSYAITEQSLWDACAGLATGLDEDLAPGDHPYNLTTEDVAGDVAAALPGLVTSACAFLDPVGTS